MSPLEREIRTLIELGGPIQVDRYMQLCLGHPRHGYYATRDPLGAGGDFVTAPEISQMFGELLGIWVASVWDMAGRPAALNLVELGPGRGTLMADALRAMKIVPGLREAASIHLVETSPALRARQEAALAGAQATWHASLASVPDGFTIALANEFFDALPVRQFERHADGWHERLVGIDADERLAWFLDSRAVPIADAGKAPDGTVLEVSATSLNLVSRLSEKITRDGGAALIVDYGDAGKPFGDTLQAVRRHAFSDPLEAPGEADLTAHVRFGPLLVAARDAGAKTFGPVTQANLLESLGIVERAEALTLRGDAGANAALARLTDREPRGMGTLFKAVALTQPGLPPPPGFS